MIQFALLAVLVGATSQSPDLFDQVASDIVARGITKVAVAPRAIYKDPENGDRRLRSPLGPLSEIYADRLYEGLVAATLRGPQAGKFSVVSETIVQDAFGDRPLEDIAHPDSLEAIGELTGADGLAVVTSTDRSKTRFGTNVEVLATNGGTVVTSTGMFSSKKGLSELAYAGQSWELRRWKGDVLENLGFESNLGALPKNDPRELDKALCAALRTDLSHPLQSEDCPYRIKVHVNGSERELSSIDGFTVVTLDPDEEYSIVLNNASSKPVYVALYVDGVNTIGKKRELPADVPRFQHWHLKAESGDRPIEGWYTKDEVNAEYTERFKIVPRENSIAAGEGWTENIGSITAIFYTVGLTGTDFPITGKTKGLKSGAFGTGAGAKTDVKLEGVVAGDPGVILAAMTIQYRTTAELEESNPLDDLKTAPSIAQVSPGNDPDIEFLSPQ